MFIYILIECVTSASVQRLMRVIIISSPGENFKFPAHAERTLLTTAAESHVGIPHLQNVILADGYRFS